MSTTRTPPRKNSVPSHINVNIDYPSGKLAALTRKKNEISKLLDSETIENFILVKNELVEFSKRFSVFREACTSIMDEAASQGLPKNKLDQFSEYMNNNVISAEEFEHEVKNWLKCIENKVNSEIQLVPHDSASGLSRRTHSSCKTSSSLKLKIAEEKAKLLVEKQYHEESIKLEEEIRLRKMEEDRRLRALKIKKSDLFVKTLEKELTDIENNYIHKLKGASSEPVNYIHKLKGASSEPVNYIHKLKGASSEPAKNTKEWVDAHSNYAKSRSQNIVQTQSFKYDVNKDPLLNVLSQQNEFNAMLIRSYEKSSLPKNEPDCFDGSDITKYESFIHSFQTLIGNRCDSEQDKLYYLEKYTVNEPHELVKSFRRLGSTSGYEEALQALHEEYGNEYKISTAYLQKLEKWPNVKNEDARGLRELSIFITSIKNLMGNMSTLNELNSPGAIMKIIYKLPFKYRDKWRNQSYHLLKNKNCINFKDFVEFIKEQSSVLNQPIFGNISDEKTEKNTKSSKKVFSTLKETPKKNDNGKHDDITCIVCKKNNHSMPYCYFFAKKEHEEKVKFIKENNLCFSCLTSGHSSKGCLHRPKCKTCQGRHLTILHNQKYIDKKKESQSEENSKSDSQDRTEESEKDCKESQTAKTAFASNKTGAGKRVICASIPVKLKLQGGNKIIQTYAGLDGFCSDVFLKKDLMHKLGIKCKQSQISLTTMEGKEKSHTVNVLNNLTIMDLDENHSETIPVVFCKDNWPFSKDDIPKQEDIRKFPYMDDVPFKFIDEDLGILLGLDMIDLIKPLKIIEGPSGMPYASLHKLGWAFNGVVKGYNKNRCHFMKICDVIDIEDKLEKLCSQEFVENSDDHLKISLEDKLWEDIVHDTMKKRDDGHYEVGLPFKKEPSFPSNRSQALSRVNSLKQRFISRPDYYKDYKEFMDMMIKNGFAEKIPENEIEKEIGTTWYVIHFGVYHKTKSKLRIVFDCSLKYKNISLNDQLMQGPDLTNNLLGVLLRFRENQYAVIGDIQKMFYQIYVDKQHTDFLRFLWFPDGDIGKTPEEYRVNVHIFGATSSPSIANYVLKHTACSHESTEEAKQIVLNNFYVDDMLKSFSSNESASKLTNEVKDLLSKGGFNLVNILSNSKYIVDSFSAEQVSENFKELITEDLPYERALGVVWRVDTDSIGFNIRIKDHPETKRGVLFTIFSIFDPFGLAAPVTLLGKKIFQKACHLKLPWDDPLTEDLKKEWQRWLGSIYSLSQYLVPRCYKISNDITETQLHIFADGSETAYAAVAYIRFKNSANEIHCSLVMSKSRLVPVNKYTLATIPRIELNAARLAVQVLRILRKELDLKIDCEHLWTDSLTVLRYLNCDDKNLQIFVANRVAYIRSFTTLDQWHHVPGKLNPADVGSRGVVAKDFIEIKHWKTGPNFLLLNENDWPNSVECMKVPNDDVEVKKSSTVSSSIVKEKSPTARLIESASSWFKAKIRVSWFLRFKEFLLNKSIKVGNLSLKEIRNAETCIILYVQEQELSEEINIVRNSKSLHKKNKLKKLCPFLDNENILRVEGRISNAHASYDSIHPIILPGNSLSVKLLIEDIHQKIGHLGRQTILSSLRERFWVIGANSVARKVVGNCLTCRKVQKKPNQQRMAHLPKERLISNESPFTFIGIDCFGPFLVCRGRVREKRYGLIFTCLTSRASHIEVLFNLDITSCINALRRFQCRRGSIKTIYSDNGTNFVGSDRELKQSINNWNKNTIENWLQQNEIKWKFNPPSASHFGGVWEREIRTIRKVLNSILKEQPIKLNDEGLSTLFCEVECVLNSRPITELSCDPNDLNALTPNHILNLKSEVTFPPGLFTKDDNYCRRRWKQVQYLSDLFWKRWRKEYIPLLQERKKWTEDQPSLGNGDLVLLVDQLLPRNQWSLGKVTNTYEDKDGRVRVVDVKTSRIKGQQGTTIVRRPIVKLILLKTNDELTKQSEY